MVCANVTTVFCVQGVSNSRAYIATQGPLPHTVVDFLRMLWEYKTEVRSTPQGAFKIAQLALFLQLKIKLRLKEL